QPGTPPNCNDNVACTMDACDEAGDVCTHTPNDGACQNGLFCDGMEVCNPTTGCQDGADPCAPPQLCDEVTDRCVDCLTSADCDDGLYCNGAETCVNGVCQPGTPPNCNDNVACTMDACDEAGDVCTHTPNDGACQNGLFCDGVEVCNPTTGCQDAADPCSPPQLCDEATDRCVDCLTNADCDDGLYCNGAETCVSGVCQPGTPPNCSDNIACTADSCDENLDACVHNPDHNACQNGLFCDGQEVCNVQIGCQDAADPCVAPLICDEPNDRCVDCLNDAGCDDGLYCNGTETCVNGVCQPGTAPDCADSVACTADTCDEATDSCVHTPDNGTCQNGLFCDGVEVCNPQSGCQPGSNPCPADSVACTLDTCDEVNDLCLHTPDDAACSDGVFCNGAEVCDPLLGCRPGGNPCPDDNVACTADSCDEATDTCLHVLNDALCDDGQFCNGQEICNASAGCLDGPDPCAPDALGCTVDVCSESTDECQHNPDNALCDDGLFCNGVEICDPLLGCRPGPDPCPPDAIACTEDGCDEDTDACTRTPNDDLCTDGLYCDGLEVCVDQVGCVGGTDPCDPDAAVCTTDACDEVGDVCEYTPDDALCDDGNPCTLDQCTPNGCVNTGDCGVCCFADSCVNQLETTACEAQGGEFVAGAALCGTDSDGDGIDDPCDQCPGVDDHVFAPGCVGAIPTVSQWGLVVLGLLLLVGGKLYYGRGVRSGVTSR
ncbi:MAG: hypothetical protein HY763_00430, partial [Planctomycetes bacterium]|nr:hypothetical protein [Planctomycetota bacterium]